MDILAKFKQFLIDNECLDSYLCNLKNFNTVSNYGLTNQFIVSAFSWCDTPEGELFWRILHWKWVHENTDHKNKKHYYFTDLIEYLSEDFESLWTD